MLLQEMEDRVAELLEKGLDVENGVIETISGVIPEDMRNSIPEPMKELLLTKRKVPSQDGQTGAAGMGTNNNKPLATWTISSVDTDDDSLCTGLHYPKVAPERMAVMEWGTMRWSKWCPLLQWQRARLLLN